MPSLRAASIVACCVALAAPDVAFARPDAVKHVKLPAQPLPAALQALARLYQVELLFSNDALANSQANALSGVFRIDEALATLLEGTGFVARHSASGGFIVVHADGPDGASATAIPVPEIVVIGLRTQNADIRRFTNDVQPYQVLTAKDIRAAHAMTVEELIGKRMSADARGLSMAQMPIASQASPQSSIDLRGLGTDETLVLIDGRRMPRLPGTGLEFVQPDLNGLSPASIDRAEIATSTAGGIYGPGAIAGVMNLVLARAYRGAEVAVTSGITQRGDAPLKRVDARIGFTPDHGATDVMLSYSRSSAQGLRVGDRDFAQRADALMFANNAGHYWYGDLPASNSVNVASSTGTLLTLKPAFGGGTLNSAVTTLPAGDGRSASAVGALLLANAGRVDTVPADGEEGRRANLTTGQEASSILANIRRRFGGLELYGDFIRLVDKGAIDTQYSVGVAQLAATDPLNPFQQAIDVSFPASPFTTDIRQRIVTTRGSIGAVVSLPAGWKGNLDFSLGSARRRATQTGSTLDLQGLYLLYGYAPPNGEAFDPFGDSATLRSTLARHAVAFATSSDQVNRMSDLSLRLAGPVASLPGGPVFLTVLAEQRRERVAPTIASNQAYGIPYTQAQRGYRERVRSGYAEVRAPLLSERSSFAPLRGLELQLAVRADSTAVDASPDPTDNPRIAYDRFTGAERTAMVYTAGLKARPLPGLLVRASLATGEMAPPIDQLAGVFLIGTTFVDPKRKNQIVTAGSYDLKVFKDPLIPERAQTLSAGFIATPFGATGPKLTLDYSRIHRSREAGYNGGRVFTFIYREDLYPGRVTRAPLTAEDAAKGYTGGVVTAVDSTYTTNGWTRIDAVDGRIDMPIPTIGSGDFDLYLAGTWQPRYRRFVYAGDAVENLTDRVNGALSVRGNAGVDWAKGPARLSLAGQYYGRYSVESGAFASDSLNARYVALQGKRSIPASVTVDLAAEYRFSLPDGGARPHSLDVRFGIQDLLDRRPATVINADGGYSFYADPRRRRFDLTLAVGL